MNKKEFTSQVKKRFEYQEARPAEEDDPSNPKAPNYDFAAKFRRNRDQGPAGRSATSERATSVKDALAMKESLVVEQDPQAVKIAYDKPPSMGYKLFVKNYEIETKNWCGIITSIVLIAFAVCIGIAMNIYSVDVTEFNIDYGTVCRPSFPGVCHIKLSFPKAINGTTLLFFLQLDNYRQIMPGLSDSFDIDQLIGNPTS